MAVLRFVETLWVVNLEKQTLRSLVTVLGLILILATCDITTFNRGVKCVGYEAHVTGMEDIFCA